MYVIKDDLMNRITQAVAANQNAVGKLNGGEIKEMVKLVINALCSEILGPEHTTTTNTRSEMPAKKKGAKKAKPAAKPMPKKK